MFFELLTKLLTITMIKKTTKIRKQNKMGIYGEGSFYKTKDGRWMGAITINGKRKVVTSKNRAIALQKFKQLKQHPHNSSTQNLTVSQVFQIYLEDKTLKQAGKQQTKQAKLYTQPIHNKKITELKTTDIEKIQNTLQQTLSNRTTNTYIKRLFAVLKYVTKKYDLTINNNIYNIDSLPEKENRESLTITQVKTLIEHIKKQLQDKNIDDILLFISLCIFTGARKGELLGLKWSDVDFKNRTISISKQMKFLSGGDVSGYDFVENVRGNVFLVDLKNKNSHRKVVIADLLLEILRFRKKNVNVDSLLFPFEFSGHVPLFAWKKLQRELNVCKSDNSFFTIHELRHSCATLMLYLGVPVDVAAKILGHSSVAMTEHYQHLSLELQREAFNKLNNL